MTQAGTHLPTPGVPLSTLTRPPQVLGGRQQSGTRSQTISPYPPPHALPPDWALQQTPAELAPPGQQDQRVQQSNDHDDPRHDSRLQSTFLPSYYPYQQQNLVTSLNLPSSSEEISTWDRLTQPPDTLTSSASSAINFDIHSIPGSSTAAHVNKPWTPKPRPWQESPLFEEVQARTSGPSSPQGDSPTGQLGPSSAFNASRMQAYPLNAQFEQPMFDQLPSVFGPNPGSNNPSHPYPDISTYGSVYQGMGMVLNMSPHVPEVDPSWTNKNDRGLVGPAEYAQALEAYKHIRVALPNIRYLSEQPGPPSSSQPFQSLLDCANQSLRWLSGRVPAVTTASSCIGGDNGSKGSSVRPSPQPEAKHSRVTNGSTEKGNKPSTYCRGCGATETPEWRRGPLGPRTLCNACGLVHMKMLRKKKKQEEKAAAAAAATSANE